MRLLHGVELSRFRSMLAQSTLAFSFSLGGLIAGFILTVAFQSLDNIIILLLFPAILTVRGDINGILSGRLGTALHTGRISPSLRKNTDEFYSLLSSTFVLTFIEMLAAGLIAFLLGIVTSRADIGDLHLFVLLPTLTGCISIIFSIPLTSILSILTFRKGLDPDVIVYPATSTMNDIAITLIYFGVAWMLLQGGRVQIIIGIIALLTILLICLILTIQQRGNKVFTKMLKEAAPVVLFCAMLGSIGGLLLGGARNIFEQKPGILIIYPASIGNIGGVGSIIGSTTTSRLHLGRITPRLSAMKRSISEITAIEISSFIMHVIYGLIAYIISLRLLLNSSSYSLVLTSISVLSNLISFLPICFLSFIIAIITFRRGLDPDNFVIPLETSIADVLATFSIYIAITIVYLFAI